MSLTNGEPLMTICSETYHPNGRRATQKQLGANGVMTYSIFDLLGRLIEQRVTNPFTATEVSTFSYDDSGNLLRSEVRYYK